MSYFSEMSYKTAMIRAVAYPNSRVPTGQGKVREICFFFKVREKSGNFKIVFVQTPQKLNKHI